MRGRPIGERHHEQRTELPTTCPSCGSHVDDNIVKEINEKMPEGPIESMTIDCWGCERTLIDIDGNSNFYLGEYTYSHREQLACWCEWLGEARVEWVRDNGVKRMTSSP